MQEALGPSQQIFDTEKMVIGTGLESAKMAIDLEAKLSADPNLRKHYDAAYSELEDLLLCTRSKHDRSEATTITISPMSCPPMHPDKEIGAKILEAYLKLLNDRNRYFDDVRHQLVKDSRLSSHLQKHLERVGCHAVWTKINKKKEPHSLDVFLKAIESKGNGSTQSKLTAEE